MLRSWLRGPFFLLTIVSRLLNTDYLAYPASPTLPNPLVRSTDCSPIVLFHIHRFIRLTYLMPRFDSYCMYHNTLDPLPIRLVVDRPQWTSSVYIRRPLLR